MTKSISADGTTIYILSTAEASMIKCLAQEHKLGNETILMSSEFLISTLKAVMLITFSFQYMIVCGTVRNRFVGILKVSNNSKVVRNHIRC